MPLRQRSGGSRTSEQCWPRAGGLVSTADLMGAPRPLELVSSAGWCLCTSASSGIFAVTRPSSCVCVRTVSSFQMVFAMLSTQNLNPRHRVQQDNRKHHTLSLFVLLSVAFIVFFRKTFKKHINMHIEIYINYDQIPHFVWRHLCTGTVFNHSPLLEDDGTVEYEGAGPQRLGALPSPPRACIALCRAGFTHLVQASS